MTDALITARRERDSAIQTAFSSREDDVKLVWLERALAAAREADRLEKERVAALTPCRACGRKVTSPCNDAEGYYEGGPWDGSCEAVFRRG